MEIITIHDSRASGDIKGQAEKLLKFDRPNEDISIKIPGRSNWVYNDDGTSADKNVCRKCFADTDREVNHTFSMKCKCRSKRKVAMKSWVPMCTESFEEWWAQLFELIIKATNGSLLRQQCE